MNNRRFDVKGFLSTLPVFSEMPTIVRENMVKECQLRRLARGDMVFRAGDPCECLQIIAHGQVKLYLGSPSGHEKIVEIVGPRDSLAETMMFLDQPHILNAQALEDTVLVCICKQVILGEIARDHKFSMQLLAGISHRMHALLKDVEGYALHSGMQRLISYLLRHIPKRGIAPVGIFTVNLPASKATIASRLSLTPEYFSRVLHELEANSLIEICKREIRIPDIQLLASYGSH